MLPFDYSFFCPELHKLLTNLHRCITCVSSTWQDFWGQHRILRTNKCDPPETRKHAARCSGWGNLHPPPYCFPSVKTVAQSEPAILSTPPPANYDQRHGVYCTVHRLVLLPTDCPNMTSVDRTTRCDVCRQKDTVSKMLGSCHKLLSVSQTYISSINTCWWRCYYMLLHKRNSMYSLLKAQHMNAQILKHSPQYCMISQVQHKTKPPTPLISNIRCRS